MNNNHREGMIDALEQAVLNIHVMRFEPVVMDSHYGGIQVAETILGSMIEALNGVGSRVLYSTDERYDVRFPVFQEDEND